MKSDRLRSLLGVIILLATTTLWGLAFVILKKTISVLPTFYVLTIRFFFAGLILAVFCLKPLLHADRRTVLHGLVLGVVLFFAYGSQTLGLRYTTPARNAFITVAYCIMTPFFVWLFYKRRPHAYNIISAVMCMVGLAFISLIGQSDDGGLHLLGDGLTLVAALFFALQLVFIEEDVRKGDNPLVLLVLELVVSGAMFLVVTLCYELPTMGIAAYAIPRDIWWRLAYLMLGSTLLAQMGQMFGQRFTSANQASVILGFEAVVGAVASVALGMESMTVFLIIGFVLVFASGIISELHIDPWTVYHHFHPAVSCRPPLPVGTAAPTPTEAEIPTDIAATMESEREMSIEEAAADETRPADAPEIPAVPAETTTPTSPADTPDED